MSMHVILAEKSLRFSSGIPMQQILRVRGAARPISRNWFLSSVVHRLPIQDHHAEGPLRDSAVAADGLLSAERFVPPIERIPESRPSRAFHP